MAFGPLAAFAGGALLGGLLGRKKKKATQKEVWPRLETPFLSEEQIKAHPITARLYEQWQQMGTTPLITQTGMFSLPPEMFQRLAGYATMTPTPLGAMQTLDVMMRPYFEQQLGRQLAQTREQLAATLGTPRGGALGEVLRRQIAEAERGWMHQLGEMGFQELQAQRGLQQWAMQTLPALAQSEYVLRALPYMTLFQMAQPFMGTFISPQVIQPTYAPSAFEQMLGPIAALAGALL